MRIELKGTKLKLSSLCDQVSCNQCLGREASQNILYFQSVYELQAIANMSAATRHKYIQSGPLINILQAVKTVSPPYGIFT